MKPSFFILHSSFIILSLALVGCDKVQLPQKPQPPRFRTAPITRTDIVRTVEATGTVTPRNTSSGIPVGAQVNGKIIKLYVDYNSVVTNGQIVALIDPLVYEANYKSAVAKHAQSLANVENQKASIKRYEATLALAEKTLARKEKLIVTKSCSQSEYDEALEARDTGIAILESARASLKSAEASVLQCEADMSQAAANLDYCTIRSPVNGVVIARKVEEGETVVSSYNAVPVLTIAEDLETIWIEATVPEADVGNIKVGQEVTFTADAYRRKFKGKVKQIRKSSTTTNNVVTFPVIIEAENPDEMLFPGMTATLSIETARAEDTLAVAAAALRFRPKDEDKEALGELPPGRKLYLAPTDPKGQMEPVVIEEGISDDAFTQLITEAAIEGREAIVGYQTATTLANQDSNNPFMPKPPSRGKNKGTAPEAKK